MSVQVGHVSIEYYPPLDSIVSEFVKELMWRRSVNCYMSGEGRVWADFSFSRMARYAVEFVEDQGYPQAGLRSIRKWLDTLSWIGETETADGDDRYIELYFEA